MGKYVRGGENFEYEYLGEASLCDLAFTSKVGRCEIFPEICFVGAAEDDDLVFYLSGENDCIPVDNREHPFDVFKDFFFSTQKYFANADMSSLLDIMEESAGNTDRLQLLKAMTEAETVYISAQCYFTLKRQDCQKMLDWTNSFLPAHQRLTIVDIDDDTKLHKAVTTLENLAAAEDGRDELPLLALSILIGSLDEPTPSFVVHDEDVAWETPVLLDGEVVGPNTEIGEFDTPIF